MSGPAIDITAVEVGQRVLVDGGGTSAAWARVDALDPERPHLAKVIYEHSRTAAWIRRARVRSAYFPREGRPIRTEES
jgi:hypothetical protein